MPNWCTNELHIFGTATDRQPLIDLMRSDHSSKFDFQKIIPMPDELSVTSGSQSSEALALFDDAEATTMLGYGWVKARQITTREELRGFLRRRYLPRFGNEGFKTLDEFAERLKSNIEKYGAPTWYEWCIKHWGTKWSPHRVEAEHAGGFSHYTFDTAWSAPIPVYEALAKRFPMLILDLDFAIEGGREGQGSMSFQAATTTEGGSAVHLLS